MNSNYPFLCFKHVVLPLLGAILLLRSFISPIRRFRKITATPDEISYLSSASLTDLLSRRVWFPSARFVETNEYCQSAVAAGFWKVVRLAGNPSVEAIAMRHRLLIISLHFEVELDGKY